MSLRGFFVFDRKKRVGETIVPTSDSTEPANTVPIHRHYPAPAPSPTTAAPASSATLSATSRMCDARHINGVRNVLVSLHCWNLQH